MNYTWENISLNNFIKCSEGNLEFVSKNNELNKHSLDAWFEIQDKYIETMDLESRQIKRYKRVCFDYAVALQKWILNPSFESRLYTKVNALFIEKKGLMDEIFHDEKMDWDRMIGQATYKAGQRINAIEWTAKEFFNLIKAMNNGN